MLPNLPLGLQRRGTRAVCWQQCRDGYRDDGALCGRTSTVTKTSYGRGAGSPLGCGNDKEQVGALCYDRCRSGYSGSLDWCREPRCRPGYTDGGLTCTRCTGDWRPWTWRCDTYSKDSYYRGVGSPLFTCNGNQEKNGALCYDRCEWRLAACHAF